MKHLIKLMRPYQWVKNSFLLAPLFFTPTAMSVHNLIWVLLGIIAYCGCSSSVYILNDIMDRHADRLHPKKSHRPIASGQVSVALACVTAVVLFSFAVGLALILSYQFTLIMLSYVAINIAYSIYLKQMAIIDIMCIAIGFVLRVEAGAVIINIDTTVWIVLCTGLLALFIAIAKRRDDLVKGLGNTHRQSLMGYNKQFLDTCLAMVLGALLVSYMIYTTDIDVMTRLGSQHLFLTVPFVIMGVLRYLQLTLVEERSGDPSKIVVRDPFILLTVLGWVITFICLMYG